MSAPAPNDQPARLADALVVPVRRSWLGFPLAAGIVLAITSAALQLAKGHGWKPASLQLDRVLSVDEDLSVLNWLTASTFLLAGLVAAVVAGQGQRRLTWIAAAAVIALVSLDEAVGLHDPISVKAEEELRRGGVRAIVVILVAAVLAGIVVAFMLRQAWPVRWRLAGAVGLIAVAAVGIDAAGPDLVNDPAARLRGGYVAKSTLEETVELGASVLMLDGMLVAALRR